MSEGCELPGVQGSCRPYTLVSSSWIIFAVS